MEEARRDLRGLHIRLTSLQVPEGLQLTWSWEEERAHVAESPPPWIPIIPMGLTDLQLRHMDPLLTILEVHRIHQPPPLTTTLPRLMTSC